MIAQLRRHPIIVGICVFVAMRIVLGVFVGQTTCQDGWQSPSIGRQGACSHHHGVAGNWGAVLATLFSIGCGFAIYVRLLPQPTVHGTRPREKPTAKPELPPEPEDVEAAAGDDRPRCRQCGTLMETRVEKTGLFQGKEVWFCP